MHATAHHIPRPSSPPDQDLQRLYNEVWAGFAEEGDNPSDTPNPSTISTTTDNDLEGIYSVYGADSNSPVSPTVHSPATPSSQQYYGIPNTSARMQNSTSPKTGAVRRLPPTPGGSSVASSPTTTLSMPEPEYYYDYTQRPSHYSGDSHTSLTSISSGGSNDLLKKATSASANGRRLPQAPTNGQHSPISPSGRRSPMPGLPVDPRPASNVSRNTSYSSTSTTASFLPTEVYRPPGALSPAVPGGYNNRHSPSNSYNSSAFDIYNTEDRRSGNGYYQQQQNAYQTPPPPPPPPPQLHQQYHADTLSVPPRVPRVPSKENLQNSSTYVLPTESYTASPASLVSHDAYLDSRYGTNMTGSSVTYQSSVSSGRSYRERDPAPEPSYLPAQEQSDNYSFHTAQPSNNYPSYPPAQQEQYQRQSDAYSYTDDAEDPRFPNPYVVQQRQQPLQHDPYDNEENVAGPSGGMVRRPTDMLRTLADYDAEGVPLEPDVDGEGEYWEDEEEEEDENRFVNFSLLSHMAVQLRDKVPRGTQVKGNIPYPRAFTGKDIVSTIQSKIQRELAINHGMSTSDRRIALQVARSLQSQLFFYEVEWVSRLLEDDIKDVYMFLDDQEGGSDLVPEMEELPTGVVTVLTRCYSPSCGDGGPCYAYGCPRQGNSLSAVLPLPVEAPTVVEKGDWAEMVGPAIVNSISEQEAKRQTIIHKLISKEEQYLQDLDIVETVFIKPIRTANPPVIQPDLLEDFIDELFGNILDLRECNRRLLEVMYVRQREQGVVIGRIGDIFLDAATEFRLAYPTYIGHHPIAEKRLKDEVETNPEFRLFLEKCSREIARGAESIRLDLKHFLNRPAEHLQKYPVLLEAILTETTEENTDREFLKEAIEAIKNLQSVGQLLTFQASMSKGNIGGWEWHTLVSEEVRKDIPKKEAKRQNIIFELIKGEMAYVKDLENIEIMYIQPLRKANPPIMAPDKLEQFIQDVFHNFAELHVHHAKLVEKFHEIQREEHPLIRSVTAAVFDAALHFRDVYMEYIPNYPIAAYRIDDEMANNPAFKAFVEQCVRHPDAHRLDMKNFINRPIPRLLRYELLLKGIMEESEPGHEDRDSIPHVIDVIKALGKETEPGVFSAKQKVELWRYNSNLVFKVGESIDMDLLDPNRSLIHSGKLLRQPESGLEWNGWSELFVLLFDNYLVMTKPKERDGVVKYHVNRRPIPLDLLTLVNTTDPPTQRSTGILRNLRGGERHGEQGNAPTPESATDSRSVYPLTLHHNGRLGGPYILYAESAQARTEWKQKIEEALGLRKVVQESNKVFEVETLSSDTFLVPSMAVSSQTPAWNQDGTYTGKVTCSVPFNTPDGRALVAIGCAEGVWIGFRHDPKSMRRVLHLKMVTQCAMLEEFGIFLVLADKSLFAYHIEALVPSSPHAAQTSQVPQKLNGTKDVHFFSVGTLHGRTLIIYMKKKGLDSIFRVLEPVGDKINERVKAPAGFGSRLGFRSAKSEWFRIYRDFFLPSESFDLIFLKARIAILCAKGFEIMDLNDFNSVTIPMREDPKLAQLAKRCESCRPMGMFRSADDEFLLCYDEFGIYVDKHGDPSRSAGTIEWEGTAERVALHSPYVLLFDSRFIEIRHVETGRLAQIIPGNDIRCIWDGRGVSSSNVVATPATEHPESFAQEAQVHAVMNSTDAVPGVGRSRAIAQHVFELIPTIPLYLPGAITSPRTEIGYSPPLSPGIRSSAGSWRS
ncbi:CNH domain-containing protein [Crucibulum laeve]|uniref:CNH domain-containing protein n=1 Tax=Crucibulum laeve TaxID=68775 RepID=A0A5C3M3G2_9AGAR|nr:CNH domain-containing protein [Crucibulum laeve]